MIQIELPNIPVAWAAARVSAKGSYNPKAAQKNFTRWQIKSLYRKDPLQGYYVIEMTFYFPVPLSASKKEKEKMLAGEIIPTCIDATNAQKFYEDCLKKIVITDDRYVAKISSEKLYGNKEKILIKVFTLQEYRNLYADHSRED